MLELEISIPTYIIHSMPYLKRLERREEKRQVNKQDWAGMPQMDHSVYVFLYVVIFT